MMMEDRLEEFVDEERICAEKDCQKTFIHSAGEQQWMKDKFGKDYSKPKRCPDCRKKNQDRKRNKDQ